jgi:pyruvate dehydrogenase E2 component (dihydrolipoamide acetyltransferase)
MAEKVLMLALSPTMEDGTIVSWHKGEGDTVGNGEVLCEVETDKATMDYESMQEGTLLKILVGEGETAKVEQPIAVIGEEGENIDEMLAEIEAEAAGGGSGEAEGGGAGKTETASDGAAGGEAGKAAGGEAASGGEESSEAGKSAESAAAADTGEAAAEAGAGAGAAGGEEPAGAEGGRTKASPLARNLARQAGLDLSRIQGSGPGGRVVQRDIETAIEGGAQKPQLSPELARKAAAAGGGGAAGAPAAAGPTGIEEQHLPVSRKRAIIAQRLSESKFSAPHYYLSLSIAVDPLTGSRKSINARRQKGGADKLSLNAFLIKIAAEAIKRFPIVNSSWEQEEIHIHGSIDIGLAVAQEDGLITPVVRNCGGKGIAQIDAELKDLVERARQNGLSPEEYTGATFSISNLGSYGIEEFTAVINPPGSAILAVGAVTEQPKRLEDGSISFDNRMKVTLSCDHRVIDGAVGADFLRTLKEIAEDPFASLV